jgi:hypothetical protein
VSKPTARSLTIRTPEGEARAHLSAPVPARSPGGALVLGHGAGGGVRAPDLLAAREGALAHGWVVALVEQPYRVAGKRSPPRAPRLDAAWIAVVQALRTGELSGARIVGGGRSSGARVACRTAAQTEAGGVLCLAFPLQPPARAGAPAGAPSPSRLPELDGVDVPTLVIQGENDRFGMPPGRVAGSPPAAARTVLRVAGDHALRRDGDVISGAVANWLAGL